MRSLWIIAAIWALLGSAASAGEGSALKSLMTRNDSKGWEAVGRLNFGGRNFCTGALIAPDLVLTAAHCLYDKENGRQFMAHEIEFLVGLRNGRANAYRGVRRAIPHPDFEFSGGDRVVRVAYDVALLQLDQPVRSASITPFETQARPRKGAQVGVVSYGHDRAESAALQEVCHVLARRSGTLVLSCDVDFGSSGAPIFSIDAHGVARIVSVISAKAEVSGRNVALGTSLEKPLGDLMALLANPQIGAAEGGVRVLSFSGSSAGSGAKFVRP
ncbi:MAG: trypsin-like serine peptidase [Paracoccaceae bacterium]